MLLLKILGSRSKSSGFKDMLKASLVDLSVTVLFA
jgi:hypothetical protein